MIPVRSRAIAAEVAISLIGVTLVAWAWFADLPWFERHVYPSYCAVSRGQELFPSVARIAALVVAAVLLVLVRPRLGRWVARSRAIDLAAIAGAVAAALLVAHVVLRSRPLGDATPVTRRDMPKAVDDPRVGWRFLPSQTMSVVVRGQPVEYAIDADGNRARAAADRIDPERPTIVVAGESIAFGESLPWDATTAARLAADLQLQVVNVGVPAYGSQQAYLRAADALARLRRPVALVTVFVPQLVRRNGLESSLGLSRLWRDEPYHGDRAVDLTRATLAATVRLAGERGARPLFLVTNFGAACAGDAWILRTLFDDQHISYVRVTLGPGDTIGPGDPHPNARGARKLADAIEAALR